MGVKHVVRNIGKGSLFGHNRIFGIHRPLDYDINKAKDPFIGLRTLAKLSRCPDPCVRQQAARNLAGRLDKLNPKFLSRFERETVIDALSFTDKFFYPLDPSSPIARIVNEATPEELGKLVQSYSYGVLSLIISNPDVPKATKLDIVSLAIRKPAYDTLVHSAYKTLKDSLTPDELHLFVDSILESIPSPGAIASYKVLSDIVQHPNTSRKTMLKLALVHSVSHSPSSFHSNIGLDAYNLLDERSLTKKELNMLANSLNSAVKERIGANPKTPRDVRFKLALNGVKSACEFADEFTLAQLEQIVDALAGFYKVSPTTRHYGNTLFSIAKNRKTPPKLVVRILPTLTSKTKEVVDEEPSWEWQYVSDEDYAAAGGDPATRQSMHMPVQVGGKSHYEYAPGDLDLARHILDARGENREKILKELKKLDIKLAYALSP